MPGRLKKCALAALILILLTLTPLSADGFEHGGGAAPLKPPPSRFDKSDWNLILLNPWNSLPQGFSVTLKSIGGSQSLDERAQPDFMQMMEDCRAEGLSPVVRSAYRSWSTQQILYTNKVNYFVEAGLSKQEAERRAATIVAYPGTSEHQAGLAVDIVDKSYQTLDSKQENTPVQKWLMENSWKYGFILRYPNDKSDITGIIYEPWHYRYVGLEAAKVIYESGLCFEEFLDRLK